MIGGVIGIRMAFTIGGDSGTPSSRNPAVLMLLGIGG